MSTGLLTAPELMAKPKALSVKLDMDVIESARVVSALTGEQQQALLSRILRPILQKMEQEELNKRIAKTGAPPAGPSVRRPKGSD